MKILHATVRVPFPSCVSCVLLTSSPFQPGPLNLRSLPCHFQGFFFHLHWLSFYVCFLLVTYVPVVSLLFPFMVLSLPFHFSLVWIHFPFISSPFPFHFLIARLKTTHTTNINININKNINIDKNIVGCCDFCLLLRAYKSQKTTLDQHKHRQTSCCEFGLLLCQFVSETHTANITWEQAEDMSVGSWFIMLFWSRPVTVWLKFLFWYWHSVWFFLTFVVSFWGRAICALLRIGHISINGT